jgi:hypothetical protein
MDVGRVSASTTPSNDNLQYVKSGSSGVETNRWQSRVMPLSRFRFSVRWMMAAVAGLAVAFSLVSGEVERQKLRADFHRERARFHGLLISLDGRAPQGVNPDAWTGALNVIFVASYSSGLQDSRRGVMELERLCNDFETKLKRNVDTDIFPWLWERFAQSGEAGRRHAESERRLFHEALDRLKHDSPDL